MSVGTEHHIIATPDTLWPHIILVCKIQSYFKETGWDLCQAQLPTPSNNMINTIAPIPIKLKSPTNTRFGAPGLFD